MTNQPRKRWYVVQANTGLEQRAMHALREQIKNSGMEACFGEILVPSEDIVEMRAGQKFQTSRKFFPGYILVQMVLNDDSWHLVRNIPKIVGFVGGSAEKPAPISDKEADTILNRLQKAAEKPRPKFVFEPGEEVRVIEGPFVDFKGIVEQVDYEKSRLKVLVSIFGRATPIELSFSHIEKES